jgi:hypothetical protein
LRRFETHAGSQAFNKWSSLARIHTTLIINEEALLALLEEAATDDELAVELFQNVRVPAS